MYFKEIKRKCECEIEEYKNIVPYLARQINELKSQNKNNNINNKEGLLKL